MDNYFNMYTLFVYGFLYQNYHIIHTDLKLRDSLSPKLLRKSMAKSEFDVMSNFVPFSTSL